MFQCLLLREAAKKVATKKGGAGGGDNALVATPLKKNAATLSNSDFLAILNSAFTAVPEIYQTNSIGTDILIHEGKPQTNLFLVAWQRRDLVTKKKFLFETFFLFCSQTKLKHKKN